MFKVTVLRMKDIIKIFIGIFLSIFIIILFSKGIRKYAGIKNKFSNLKININNIINIKPEDYIEQTIPTISSINKDYENGENKENKWIGEKDILYGMLKTQISSIDSIESNSKESIQENSEVDNDESNQNQNEEVQIAETEVITNNTISEKVNVQYGNVKIKNETSYELTDDILEPNITIENKNIIIFHTHSCESYTSSEEYPYQETGNFRTTDLDFTVTRVGTELEAQLKKYNYNVVHSTDYHDYPSYNGSYTRSLTTVENLLKTTPADIIIDLHRDAIGSRSDYAPTVKIGDKDEAAQIMFVIGTNDGGLWHPNWQQNLKFAIKVQEKAEEMYPRII